MTVLPPIDSYRLFWRDTDLGEVGDLTADYPEMWGAFVPGPGLDTTFQGLFAFVVDEDRIGEEPPFADELLDDENWWLVDGGGTRWGIFLPAVYADGAIGWRWRGEAPR